MNVIIIIITVILIIIIINSGSSICRYKKTIKSETLNQSHPMGSIRMFLFGSAINQKTIHACSYFHVLLLKTTLLKMSTIIKRVGLLNSKYSNQLSAGSRPTPCHHCMSDYNVPTLLCHRESWLFEQTAQGPTMAFLSNGEPLQM